ncbi:MAG: hypothetical protein KME64_11890 [Scytonematopsis contorta HA4267-MV1]|jgi:hypothetical protein|nr:hypothetical protein [Scytonematopsis contorta HA4267-MV1]
MKAIEVTGRIDIEGNLILDKPIKEANYPHQVRIIVLVPEPTETEEDDDSYDTPVEEVKASLKRALEQAKSGQTRPISELWGRIDAE